jgi:PAS domain S-box-containing protein
MDKNVYPQCSWGQVVSILQADRLIKNIFTGKVSIGFATTLLVLILNAIVAYQSINKISENNQSAAHSNDISTALAQMLSTLKDVEMGQREYLLTNNPRYLTAHRVDLIKIRQQLQSLVVLSNDFSQPTISGNTATNLQPLSVIVSKDKINRELSALISLIDRSQSQVVTVKGQALFAQQGKQSIDQIRQTITSLGRLEQTNLDRRQAESRKSLADTKITFGIAGLIDLLLLTIIYGLINRDLLTQKQAELTLRDYVAEFEELYHNAPCGYHSLDQTGKFVRINRTELQMLGYEEAEIIGHKYFVDLLTPASMEVFNLNFPVVKTRGWIHDLELELVRKDGQTVPISATVVVVKDPQGKYLSSRSTLIDISDRVRLRKQAKLSAEISQKIRQSLQLTEILQTAVEEVQKLLQVDRVLILRFEADGSGTVVEEQVLPDYPTIMGQNIVDPYFDRSYQVNYTHGEIHTAADITQAGFQPCYVNFLQQFAVKSSSIVPIHLRDELWGLLVVHHCQSLRQWPPKELEIMSQLATQIGIALAQSQLLEQEQIQGQELARSNADLEQFAYIASHDLQEPLRMVIGYLQLLSRRYQGKLDPDADEFINYAVDGAVRMKALIQALLSYARVSSRKHQFDVVKCDLVLQDAISNLYVAIAESGAIVSADPLPEVWGDATQLTQVFQNLIANAIKFRGLNPPQIHISVQPTTTDLGQLHLDTQLPLTGDLAVSSISSPSAWCFAVADNGIGIEAQYLDRIFVIFQRLHTRDSYPGTGIGLAICKKIVERHGGTIWVESIPATTDLVASLVSDPTSISVLQQPLSIQRNCCGSIFYFIIPAVGSISLQHDHKQSHH